MSDSTSAGTGPAAVVPAADLTIAQAAAARDQLLECLADGRATLRLDLGGVSDLDSAGVQLLLATRRSLIERGGQLQITAVSPTVRDALKVFGLDTVLSVEAHA